MSASPNATISPVPYGPLPSGGDTGHCIRLIAIKTDARDTELQWQLSAVPLAEATSQGYYTLSYVWGNAADTQPIRVNGLEFQATRNLVLTLKQLFASQQYATSALWVDSICINQADISERKIPGQNHGSYLLKCKRGTLLAWAEDDSNVIATRIINSLSQDLDEYPEMTLPPEHGARLTPVEDSVYLDLVRELPRPSLLRLPVFWSGAI